MPIDLPTALRVVNTANPTIALARERVREAYAALQLARAQLLPNLEAGPTYNRHDGLLQTSSGNLIFVSKWNFFIGGGAAASLDTAQALFEPLVARRLVQAQAAASRAVTDAVQLDVALAYLDLLEAYGLLAINAETLAHAEETNQIAQAAEDSGFGKTPADAARAWTELAFRRQKRFDLEGRAATASARLAQLLLLQPTLDLRPVEPAVVPIALVPVESPLEELVAAGLMARPELAESRALVAAALMRWRQARVGPLLPRLDVTYLAGDFGGGTQDNTQLFHGRGDGLAEATWTLHNFGVGDVANAHIRRSQYNQSMMHVAEVQAQVAAQVTAAAKEVRARQLTLAEAQEGVRQGEALWRRILRWTREVAVGRVRRFEAVELVTAEQQLNGARVQYLNEVIGYNRAQFRLYWAMGQPPACALPQATALPVETPATPPPAGSAPAGRAPTETAPPPRKLS
jgi:outer membrane protein TolC